MARQLGLVSLLCVLAVGCGPVVGQNPADSEGDSAGTETGEGASASGTGSGGGGSTPGNPSTSGGTTSATSGGVTSANPTSDGSGEGSGGDEGSTGGGSICEGRNPLYTCGEPADCGEVRCGDYLTPWDADGCLRPACGDDTDCDGEERCFRPFTFGGCISSHPPQCADEDGACVCGGQSLPDCGGGYCIPADAMPPAACNDIEDEEACAEATCHWIEVAPVLDDSLTYSCGQPVGTCTWFPEGEGGDDVLTPYMRFEGTTTEFPVGWAVFPASYDTPPLGWIPCGGPGPLSDVCAWWNAGPPCE